MKFKTMLVLFSLLASSMTLAANTLWECSVTNAGPAGPLRIELGNDGAPFYIGTIENIEDGVTSLGRLENVVSTEANFSGIIYGNDGEISAYLHIANNKGSFYVNRPTSISDRDGLNKELILDSCHNPNK